MLNNNKISCQIEDYISYKQSLGYLIKVESQELRRFATYTRNIDYNGSLTVDLAMKWSSLNKRYSRWYMSRRLETIHTFAVYISTFDVDAQVPQNGVFGRCHGRVKPYIYTENEIKLLMNETDKLFSPDGTRSLTVRTTLGLLWATGLRVSELTLLKDSDINFENKYIFIQNSKFKKDRLIPLHPSVIEKLKYYQAFISNKYGKHQVDDYFFVTSYGHHFNTRSFEYAFQLIRPCIYNTKRIFSRNPRLYDLRHTFACRAIQNWMKIDGDLNQKIHLLSTYMGHVKPADTYWYLSATPTLLATTCKKWVGGL